MIRQRMNLLKMKIKRKRMAVFLNGLRNGLSENKYLRKLRGLRSDNRCSMTDDTKIAIEACCQATSGFGPRSVGPSSFWIGLKSVRSKSNLLSVRSDSISKNVGPSHWTGPDRDRTEVVHPCRKPDPDIAVGDMVLVSNESQLQHLPQGRQKLAIKLV